MEPCSPSLGCARALHGLPPDSPLLGAPSSQQHLLLSERAPASLPQHSTPWTLTHDDAKRAHLTAARSRESLHSTRVFLFGGWGVGVGGLSGTHDSSAGELSLQPFVVVRAKSWCRICSSWRPENFALGVLDVCQRHLGGNSPHFSWSIMFTFAAFCYMLSLVLCVSLIFFAIWHVSTSACTL